MWCWSQTEIDSISTRELLANNFSSLSAPDPPANLSVIARSGKAAVISWSPPSKGNFSAFKLRVSFAKKVLFRGIFSHSIFVLPQILGLSDAFATNRTVAVDGNGELQYQVRDLLPGASYQVQAYTVFDNRESLAYTSRNFTTSKFTHSIIFAFKSSSIPIQNLFTSTNNTIFH